MKRPALILLVVLLIFALAACDSLLPPVQEALPTAVVSEGAATPTVQGEAAPTEETPVDAPAPEATAVAADLVGTTWEWATVIDPMGQTIVADPTRYTILFNADGSAAIKADCNQVTANYVLDGANVSVQLGATTLAACGPDSQDTLFLNSLSRTSNYAVQDGELFIALVGDSGTLIFRPAGTGAAGEDGQAAEEPALVGPTWQWVSTTTPTEVISVVDPTRYTIVFNEDGTANITADCNSVGATYTADASALSITLGASTMVACPPDSQVNPFLAGIAGAALYFFEDGNLYIDMVADSGTMQFVAQAAEGDGVGMGEGSELTSATWQWFATTSPTTSTSIADPTRYTVTFNTDNSLAIKADCNMVLGSYTAGEDGSLSILLGPSTLAACPEDSQAVEFLAYLTGARFYFVELGTLSIEVAEDGTTLQFNATDRADGTTEGQPESIMPGITPSGLTGVTWQWSDLVQANSTTAIQNPAGYTIMFNADGTASIQADCNSGGATYTAGEDGSLTITPGAFTLAYCGTTSLDQPFIGGLTNAKSYRLEEGRLTIDMLYESGSLVFAPGQ